jgi:hypothetical protein
VQEKRENLLKIVVGMYTDSNDREACLDLQLNTLREISDDFNRKLADEVTRPLTHQLFEFPAYKVSASSLLSILSPSHIFFFAGSDSGSRQFRVRLQISLR